MIRFEIENKEGSIQVLELPEGINLSLMEVLKASDYPIAATCGGMALCATCHIEVVSGLDKLGSLTDAEMDMIDTLPDATENSRLACQIRLDDRLHGAVFKLV
ncbi:MAG TPA: 2Fe-2S iron-sulfur cluster-binding protein [Ohtaekwangia sp.]